MAARAPSCPASPPRQRGMSLIELMVGVVIGLIAILVIYQTFAVAEGVKRQTISAGDAQKTGMIAMYLIGAEVGQRRQRDHAEPGRPRDLPQHRRHHDHDAAVLGAS